MYERRAIARRRFESLVRRAVRSIPPDLAQRLENVDIVVKTRPSAAQLSAGRVPAGHTLLGLYVGTDLSRRGGAYTFAMPDRIFIFQEPLERLAKNEDELTARIRQTVLHEIAHHFGISDARLHEIDRY
ncbi:MAG TPA: metallopeptidase family protein [Dehalococcoidia bacterium]|nr:metallopeptidase family protein [Dehalococcoidia bacterium]